MRPALINMGSVLTANNTVETDPASTATVAMSATLRSERLPARRVPYPSCRSASWVNSRTTGPRNKASIWPHPSKGTGCPPDSTPHQLLGLCAICRGCGVQVTEAEWQDHPRLRLCGGEQAGEKLSTDVVQPASAPELSSGEVSPCTTSSSPAPCSPRATTTTI